MGQCGCADTDVSRAIKLEGADVTLGVHVYHGCRDCFDGPGVIILALNPQGVENWCPSGVKPETITADENGGADGYGLRIALFEVSDLCKAVEKLIEAEEIEGMEEYGSISDWLSDNGLPVIQEAMRLHEQKERDLRDRKNC